MDDDSRPVSRGFKKVFSRPQRSTTSVENAESERPSTGGLRSSLDSQGSRSVNSTADGTIDDGSKTAAVKNGFSKLIHHKSRKARRQSEVESIADGDDAHSSQNSDAVPRTTVITAPDLNVSISTLDNSLLTDDEEETPPPLISRDSHSGFLTSSSPLINTVGVDGQTTSTDSDRASRAPLTSAGSLSAPSTETLGSTKRSRSPRRTLKDVFSTKSKSNDPSPERQSINSAASSSTDLTGRSRHNSLSAKRSAKSKSKSPGKAPPLPPPIITTSAEKPVEEDTVDKSTPRPFTPPSAIRAAPLTTVTPPTPTESRRNSPIIGHNRNDSDPSFNLPPNAVVSPSGNMISHRRARSTSSVHAPSKLSNAISVPLTPLEEIKTPAGSRTPSQNLTGGGFFSSVVSAAQNAASTITTSFNPQTKGKNTATTTEPDETQEQVEESAAVTTASENLAQKKELAVDTLGQGELNFSHLGLDTGNMSSTDQNGDSRKESAVQRDEASARIEDAEAARAVSAAYEKPANEEGSPPDLKPSATFNTNTTSSTKAETPNGSIFEGETGASGVKRSGSVRSRIAHRTRGSSGVSSSTIGAMIGASTSTLANPAAGGKTNRLTGFIPANKKRNKDFHSLFRSVPEDDYLIEDYSCALQRDIILAGRIYISEGHVCFSSNILGWVTNLVISFDEVVSVEKESTAMVFPNAIAIQTLHARHTFRSLLSREATYDLMVNIWKVNHPSLQSSVNGTRLIQGGKAATTVSDGGSDSELDSDDDDDIYDEDAEDEGAGSIAETVNSVAGSDGPGPEKVASRKPSTMALNGNIGPAGTVVPSFAGDQKGGEKAGVAGAEASEPFPGPPTHGPTEYGDPNGQYDKVVKDEVIPAPLGKVYNMLFGPASGVFLKQFLSEDQKVTELNFEDDKKGLTNDSKSRGYNYIKPLSGAIGPKQTKCITNETLEVFDLEKAVLVSMTTQTPDVPNGNVFSVKTKYLLTWGPNNGTRFLMTCFIEWTGKSWIKGPIEKGSNDGQLAYGTDIIRAIKAGVTSTGRGSSSSKPGAKGSKGKKKRGDEASKSSSGGTTVAATKKAEPHWGLFEPVRPILSPVTDIFAPLWTGNVAVLVIGFLLFTIWFRGSSSSSKGLGRGGAGFHSATDRAAFYEEIWRQEESELWDWLEERVALNGLAYPNPSSPSKGKGKQSTISAAQQAQKQRQKVLGGKNVEAKLREEKMSLGEMQDAIRVTQERLDVLRDVVGKKTDGAEKEVDGEKKAKAKA